MRKITTPINEHFISENNILYVVAKEGAFMDLESIKEDFRLSRDLVAGKKIVLPLRCTS